MKKVLWVGVLLSCVLLLSAFAFAAAKYPNRNLTDVVVWSAGGGTDVCNRVIMAEMEKFLGVTINVVNMTGGVAGSIGMNYVYSQPHDGYTLCGLSESCTTAGVQGGFDKGMKVWDFFIVGGSPDIVSVGAKSPYQSLSELIEAAKNEPGKIKAGASGAGSIHHLNLLALEDGTGADFNFIPYPGSAPTQNAALTGEISLVITSAAEQAQLIRAGKLRPLAVLTPEPFTIDEITIPSAFDFYPELAKYLPISQAIGFAVPADVPEDVKNVLIEAFKKAMATDKMKKWAEENFYVLSGKAGEEAKKEFLKLESLFSWTLWELGAAKVNPEELGIPKPEEL